MLKKLHQLLADVIGGDVAAEAISDIDKVRLASAVLLVEIVRADDVEDRMERELAERLLRERFELDEEQTRQLFKLAEQRVASSVSLFEFTNNLKDALEESGRGDIVEMLWDVVYADGEVDRYEEHLMRRIAELLYVTHSEFIRRKLLAAERAGISL